jgi:hypothetical protein
MKKPLLIIFGSLGMLCGNAQQTMHTGLSGPNVIHYPNGVDFVQCESFELSRPLRDLAAEQAAAQKTDIFDVKEADDKKPIQRIQNPNGIPQGEDPIAQTVMGTRNLTTPMVNFTAQSPGQGSPLDPTGAAGLTAYVQAVNSNYRAYNKATGAPLMNSLSLSTLWAGTSAAGDPVVLYDKYADRWFIMQFQLPSNNKVLIAISQTNDPTGAFYKYTFSSLTQQPDYLKFSIWPDGYYMTANFGLQICIFDRTKMLAGDQTASMILKTLPNFQHDQGFYTPNIADADGTLPPNGTPATLFGFEDNNAGGSKDQIHVIKITTNWTTPSSTTAVEDTPGGSPLATAAFNSTFSAAAMSEISQKGSSNGIDAIQGIFMFRAQYRVWAGYNSVLLSGVVNADGNGKAGIRWYELRQNNTTKVWSIYQQGTYAPDGDNRWMSSIAMDDNGSIALAYAVSGPNSYPSLRYTGRYSSDPLGTMPFAEVTAKAGTSAKTGNNRWGDYSHTALDPDGKTFWHTGMWMSSSETSQIYSFQITQSTATGIDENKKTDPSYSAYFIENSNLLVKASNLASDDLLMVDLFDVEGKLITDKKIKPSSNMFETNFDTNGLAKGTYLVRIGNISFQKVMKVIVN